MTRSTVAVLLAACVIGTGAMAAEDSGDPCAGGGELSRRPGNLLVNGGFEEGRSPWYHLEGKSNWGGFSVSGERACHGEKSLKLELRRGEAPVMILGAIQDVAVDRFPERLSGRYFVESWTRGSSKQYVQVVLILDPGNRQLRYILAGLDAQPYRTGPRSDARYLFLGPRDGTTGVPMPDPEVGRWISFETDPARDLLRHWNIAPAEIEKVRCYFEVRYDSIDEASPGTVADVFYDDLYLGPAVPGKP